MNLSYEANIRGLLAFNLLPLADRLKRLIAIGILDAEGNLSSEYGGSEPPAKVLDHSDR